MILAVILSSSLNAAEFEKCPDREVVQRGMLEAPRVTELREGIEFVSAIVDVDGKCSGIEKKDLEEMRIIIEKLNFDSSFKVSNAYQVA
ncbi:MAG: hypothetical protein JKX81_06135 [Arenicella sp.]|nr:hypothetical protein [Arenicella sp.]